MATPIRSFRLDEDTMEKLEAIQKVYQKKMDAFFEKHEIGQLVTVSKADAIKTMVEAEYDRLELKDD